jgi:hypothetical protein
MSKRLRLAVNLTLRQIFMLCFPSQFISIQSIQKERVTH